MSKIKWKTKRLKATLRWKLLAKPISEGELVSGLQSPSILRAGDIVMTHSSLSAIGKVVGGPEAVCRALQKVLTGSGTLLMPSYHQPESVLKMIKDHKIVDLRTAISSIGRFSETFRTLPGVMRSSHPFSSVCAWGRYAAEMLRNHSSTPFICGQGSPLFELLERSGKYMGIGVDIRIVGLYHVLEDNWSDFPIKVHYPEQFLVKYIDMEGQLIERELIILDPDISMTRIDQEVKGAWIRKWLTNHMKARGILHEFKLGQASSWIVDAKVFYEELKSLALRGITIYTTEEDFEASSKKIPNLG